MLGENASVSCRGTERTTHIMSNAYRKRKKKRFSFLCEVQGSKQVIPSQLGIMSPLFTQIYDEVQLSGVRLLFCCLGHCNLCHTQGSPQHSLSAFVLISSLFADTQPQLRVDSFAWHYVAGMDIFYFFQKNLLCCVLKCQGNNILIYTKPSNSH